MNNYVLKIKQMKNKFFSLVITLAVGIALAFIVKFFVLESYTVPTDSMEPTILRGSKVGLLKLPFTPKRGDVVGFQHNSESFVKRVTGVPLDSVVKINGYFGLLTIENRSLATAFFKIPKAGETLVFNDSTFDFYRPLIESEGVQAGHILNKIFINNLESITYTFKRNYYFVEGDNPAVSIDSRTFGLISEKDILGKVLF
jgi:signal peptidase I